MTTPEPAKVSPVDTGLRALVAEIRDCLGLPDDADLGEVESLTKTAIRTADDLTVEYDRVRAERDAARAEMALRSDVVARLQLENETLRLTSRYTPALPDGAAERLTYALFRMAPGPFRNAPAAPVHALMAPFWKHVWRDLSDEERAEWLEYGNGVLAELGLSSPATDPAPLEHLTWSVVHVPPGTRDREDVDTEIRSGWWLLGVGEDPDVPVVQVRLGETLPVATDPEPATPDGPRQQCAWWGDTRQCPDWSSPGFDLCGTHQREHDRLNEPVAPQDPAEPIERVGKSPNHHGEITTPAGPAVPEDTGTCPACVSRAQHTIDQIQQHHRDGLTALADAVAVAREDTATRGGLVDATHVVNLHRSTRCTGCNSIDQWWCSCPDGYSPPDEYGDDLNARFLKPDSHRADTTRPAGEG